MVDRLTVLFLKFLEYFHKLQLFIWWLLEIHIIKIVSCYIVLVSIKEVPKAQKRKSRRAASAVVPRAPTLYWSADVICIDSFVYFFVSLSAQVSLLNYVFLASWAFALPYSHYRPLASSVCTVWTCVIIICKMLYQLKSINPLSYSRVCPMVSMTAFVLIIRIICCCCMSTGITWTQFRNKFPFFCE